MEEEQIGLFRDLRNKIQDECYDNLTRRREQGPPMTPEEYNAGEFMEGFEPQCVDAIFSMRRKGYNTASSGFVGPPKLNHLQFLFGKFRLPENIQVNLRNGGYRYGYDHEKGISYIEFDGKEPSVEVLKTQWDKLADMLPDLGRPAAESTIPHAVTSRGYNEKLLAKKVQVTS